MCSSGSFNMAVARVHAFRCSVKWLCFSLPSENSGGVAAHRMHSPHPWVDRSLDNEHRAVFSQGGGLRISRAVKFFAWVIDLPAGRVLAADLPCRSVGSDCRRAHESAIFSFLSRPFFGPSLALSGRDDYARIYLGALVCNPILLTAIPGLFGGFGGASPILHAAYFQMPVNFIAIQIALSRLVGNTPSPPAAPPPRPPEDPDRYTRPYRQKEEYYPADVRKEILQSGGSRIPACGKGSRTCVRANWERNDIPSQKKKSSHTPEALSITPAPREEPCRH